MGNVESCWYFPKVPKQAPSMASVPPYTEDGCFLGLSRNSTHLLSWAKLVGSHYYLYNTHQPSWLQTSYVAKNDIEFLIYPFYLPSNGITSVDHCIWVLCGAGDRTESFLHAMQVLYRLTDIPSHFAPFPFLNFFFNVCLPALPDSSSVCLSIHPRVCLLVCVQVKG